MGSPQLQPDGISFHTFVALLFSSLLCSALSTLLLVDGGSSDELEAKWPTESTIEWY